MTKVGVVSLVLLLAVAGTAAAANPEGPGSMAAALKALHYPKPAKKLSCHHAGSGFKCKATLRHGHKTVYAEWANTGGWVCAGKTLTGCKVLRHGFVSKSSLARYQQYGGLKAYAGIASTGYLENKYQATPNVTAPCAQAGASSWACGYSIPSGNVTVTITYKQVKTGWLIRGAG